MTMLTSVEHFFMLLINNSLLIFIFMTHQLWNLLKMSQTNII